MLTNSSMLSAIRNTRGLNGHTISDENIEFSEKLTAILKDTNMFVGDIIGVYFGGGGLGPQHAEMAGNVIVDIQELSEEYQISTDTLKAYLEKKLALLTHINTQ